MLFYMTAGESHGPQLTGIINGLPAGLEIDVAQINAALTARQGGYGRGNRQKIEHDQVKIVGGLRHSVTLGSPLALTILNKDFAHWQDNMDPLQPANERNTLRQVTRPRPGHADLVGGMKYRQRDLRNVLERSSARETAMRVAIGNICQQLLAQLDIDIVGYVQQVGNVNASLEELPPITIMRDLLSQNDLRILDQTKVEEIHELIDTAKKDGDTVGGVVRVVVENVPAGLGSYTSWDTKLDAKLAGAVMGVNAIKGVSFGQGFAGSQQLGSQVMDAICYDQNKGWGRLSNHLGGFEGGMTNGQSLVINAAMKPLPTLYRALPSVNILTKEVQKANVERSDTTAIVPASIVVASVVAIELAQIITETFDGSNMTRLKEQVAAYRQELQEY
ncbi:chorismate synthase [Bombilactobacillus thymidiniphilus]|uniref:Chorismate synthase n=1 Tax=Bombilactobacillus thymidiniphilus TaxID=2923363 RepID=A0ABY4PFE8_9LACO|nr:chorismate synthase [Bombilactobacillus thymidiniphilus]UQS84332.1 chorismate synthase [Bombilactobacillus thymidiniphilus]